MEKKEKPEILVLGMGMGTFALQAQKFFPNVSVSGVEIDQKITDLAHEYFELPEEIPVTTYDGRAYLYADRKKYDVIMVDAYQDITIPFQMSSVEFFRLVRSHLNPGGVMVVNMNMHTEEAGNINAFLSDTIAEVFPAVQTVDVKGTTNRELFASEDAACFASFQNEIAAIRDPELKSLMYQVQAELIPYEAGTYVFTDDKAPVELMGMRAIDALIQDELGYYKEVFHEKGLAGLLEEF